MTVAAIAAATEQYPYIALRRNDGYTAGYNSRFVELIIKRMRYHGNMRTHFQAWYPLTFSDYIRIKSGFVPSKKPAYD